MTWLVFGVSCLLVLAGAVSIISGAPIIQLERGWAEVISGTVALSSGGVVFALAGILMRLESIRDTMAARIVPVAADSLPAPRPMAPETRLEALPTAVPADTKPQTAEAAKHDDFRLEPETAPVPAQELQDDETATQGLWKRVKRPGSEEPIVETLRQQGFPDRVVPDAPGTAPKTEISVVVPAHAVPAPPAAPSLPSQSVDPAPSDAATAGPDAGQIGWLERSLFKGRLPQGAGAAPRPEPTFDARPVEPRLAPIPAPPVTHDPNDHTSDTAEIAEPEPTPDLVSEFHKDATVVGRYQAGSASYVMYSDGTIEVETESGEMHRFGSMDELKAFIAQQDSAIS